MSTKFSVRPAPRKKPWICKRSPPCLEPDPWPLSVLCTYDLTASGGAWPPERITGTFTVPNMTGPWTYIGPDPTPGKFFHIHFVYDPVTHLGVASSQFSTPHYTDLGFWESVDAGPPPSIRWHSYHVQGSLWMLRGNCLITN